MAAARPDRLSMRFSNFRRNGTATCIQAKPRSPTPCQQAASRASRVSRASLADGLLAKNGPQGREIGVGALLPVRAIPGKFGQSSNLASMDTTCEETSSSDWPCREGTRMASSLTRNQVPGNRLRVRIPCPPLDWKGSSQVVGSLSLAVNANRLAVVPVCRPLGFRDTGLLSPSTRPRPRPS